jgi:hypothetical protein
MIFVVEGKKEARFASKYTSSGVGSFEGLYNEKENVFMVSCKISWSNGNTSFPSAFVQLPVPEMDPELLNRSTSRTALSALYDPLRPEIVIMGLQTFSSLTFVWISRIIVFKSHG